MMVYDVEKDGYDSLWRLHPLVMTNIVMENHYAFNGKIHHSMAIFNSYVSDYRS